VRVTGPEETAHAHDRFSTSRLRRPDESCYADVGIFLGRPQMALVMARSLLSVVWGDWEERVGKVLDLVNEVRGESRRPVPINTFPVTLPLAWNVS